MQKLSKLNKNKIRIKLAQLKDLKFTLKLYNQNVLKGNFFSKKKVCLREHREWFKAKLKEKMFFICSSTLRFGYIRYDILKNKDLSVSIATKTKFRRNGFGKYMLAKTLNRKKIINKNVYAFIKKNNTTSKKFFLSAGFKYFKKNTYVMKAREK